MQEESAEEESRYLVVVFGPPASGKSTLAQHLKTALLNSHSLSTHDCVIVSADCLEQYLSGHSLEQLESLLVTENGWQIVNSYKLKRSAFRQQVWKRSRDFIKQNVVNWLTQRKVLILQDDLLLRSQRKHMRQQLEHSDVLYLEIMMKTSLEKCLENCQRRNQEREEEEKLAAGVVKECYNKFEAECVQYCIAWHPQDKLGWELVQLNARRVVIEHPELKLKEAISQQSAAKDLVETQIRTFVSEVLGSQEARQKYLKDKNPKEAAALLSKLKKNYKDKCKSLEGFRAYLQHQMSKML